MTLKRFENTDRQIRTSACACGAPLVSHGRRGTLKTQCDECADKARNAARRARRKVKRPAGASA